MKFISKHNEYKINIKSKKETKYDTEEAYNNYMFRLKTNDPFAILFSTEINLKPF